MSFEYCVRNSSADFSASVCWDLCYVLYIHCSGYLFFFLPAWYPDILWVTPSLCYVTLTGLSCIVSFTPGTFAEVRKSTRLGQAYHLTCLKTVIIWGATCNSRKIAFGNKSLLLLVKTIIAHPVHQVWQGQQTQKVGRRERKIQREKERERGNEKEGKSTRERIQNIIWTPGSCHAWT